MRKLLVRSVGGTLAAAVIAVSLPLAAQAASTVDGTLTAMSGTTLPAVLTVQSGITAYTVNVTADTKLVRLYGGPSSLEEFVVGDLLRVEGTVTGTTIDATKIKNLSIQRKGSMFWGNILSIDSTAKSFVIDPSKPKKSLSDQTVLTNSKTKVFQGNRAGEFSDLSVGMTVKVIGVWRPSLNQLTADRILIKLTELNGTVTAVDCSSTPKMLTVQTKKGKDKTSWTVNLTDKTVIRDKNLDPITCADVMVNHRVHVRGLRTGTATMNALQVWDRDVNKSRHAWKGTISSIDGTALTFVLDQKKGDDRTVAKTSETILVNKNGSLITFADLAVGHEVQVWGTLSGTTITANLVMDKDLPVT
ncbi:MAG: hypothetical protein HY420_04810 [Candidatus Kerfeldbacteria bacterium]|nr:hypothetical protein [Candidatus Kerfeldbacteria bacterium]